MTKVRHYIIVGPAHVVYNPCGAHLGGDNMCGICGIYDNSFREIDQHKIVVMRDVMINRGPDDAGLHIGPHIGLGHRRLSIIDLSAAGHQPMANEDGTIWIVFNGEIYNFLDVRDELIEKDHFFISCTDTEVLIHGYEEWGIDGLLRKINGMFAFALWDSRREELLLARDRLGVKPLFYLEKNGKVYFSSDIKSIYLGYDGELSIDYKAIDHFLFSYCIPQQYSIFREIRKVLPAQYIRFRRAGKKINKYWHLSFAEKDAMTEEAFIEESRKKLLSAVKRRMIGDVPIGAFLSGGVDSGLVVALMAAVSDFRVKTFSMGVKEESYNELKFARMIAERYSTEHYEFIVEPDALSILPEIIWAYGEPFADSSQIPTYYVSKMTKGHVTVALTGDGGDEAFGGYNNYKAQYVGGLYRRLLPSVVGNRALPFISDSLEALLGRRGMVSKMKTMVEYGSGNFADSLKVSRIFGFEHRDKLYSGEFKYHLQEHEPTDIYQEYLAEADGLNEVDKALYIDIKTRLPNDYLTKVDVATMMNSLEARSPFLDYEVMEFAGKIPSNIKLKYGKPKYLLKKLAEKYVPADAIYRKKWGFGIPIGFWFRDNLYSLLKEVLLSDKSMKRGYFNSRYVGKLVDDHLAGRVDHTHRLWTLLCLELWHLIFIDRSIISQSDVLKTSL